MDQAKVFKALADDSRRKLLDLLFLKQGRSLTELEEHLPMTRFGVMKHLKILKEAGLVTTKRSGRETLHYLNAVPIQTVYDRWVSKYARGWARSLTELKYDLEEETAMKIKSKKGAEKMAEAKAVETTQLIFEVYIKATPERLWQAITDGSITDKYYFGCTAKSDWKPGSEYRYINNEDKSMIGGKVLEADPPRRLVTTFDPLWSGCEIGERSSRVTYVITPMGETCRLTLTHDDLIVGDPINEGFREGWSTILSGLKTYLETGEPLIIQKPEKSA